MNGYERIRTVFNGEWPDKVPVMLHNFMMAAREAGYSMAEYRSDPKKIARAFIQAVETYEYDGILVDIDTVTLAGAVGVPIDFPDDDPARSNRGNISPLEMVRNLEMVDISEYEYVQNALEAVNLIKKHFGDEVFIRGNCDQDPFSLASMMRSPQEWMMDLYDTERRDLVFDLLEYCTDVTIQFIRLMVETGAHMVSNGDSPAGPELISPQMYEEFAFPYEKRVVEAAHGLGLPYALHICGDTSLIIKNMLETGTDAVELDYKTDIERAHNACKDSVVFIGNIDPSGVIALGSTEEVQTAVQRVLEIYSDSPRFILNAGCAIPSSTPSENIRALIETARRFR
jgi:MtaA/CmuA family methyltransferase